MTRRFGMKPVQPSAEPPKPSVGQPIKKVGFASRELRPHRNVDEESRRLIGELLQSIIPRPAWECQRCGAPIGRIGRWLQSWFGCRFAVGCRGRR